MSRKNQAVKQLRTGIEGLLRAGKIEVVQGTATVTGEKQVIVRGETEKTLTADTMIIATGSRPILPPIPGIDTTGVMTSDDILSLAALPKRLAIIGGGVIGVEFATIFSEVGVEVVVIEAAERILPNMDAA
ncbi:FAD-dependent oxidoreductase, partial [Microbacteriaceae bacterium K1510]|nr:FAD-dependent oxidoreductase [Microbacteriaceae bacterium K1510]